MENYLKSQIKISTNKLKIDLLDKFVGRNHLNLKSKNLKKKIILFIDHHRLFHHKHYF